jgi:hypothetical protein
MELNTKAYYLYKDPEAAIRVIGEIQNALAMAEVGLAGLLKISTGGRIHQGNIESTIRGVREQRDFLTDEVELLQTGVEADIRRMDEDRIYRKAKAEAIAGFTVVKRGKVRKADKVWSNEQMALMDVDPGWVGANVQINTQEVYRKR